MFVEFRKPFGHAAATLAAALLLSGTASLQPASAQNLLEAIFGGFDRAIRREMSQPPMSYSYADPRGRYDDRRERRAATAEYTGVGPSSGYCVRTCDGKYFPVRSSGHMSATELCRAFCPAAQTKVFGGGKIDYATAGDGTRYAHLPTAFLYRERTVPGCTCNGRTAGGLAPLDPESDPTLRPGDIVATNDGLATYTGNRKSRTAEFTPIDQAQGGSNEWRRRLMSIKVMPTPQRADEPNRAETPEHASDPGPVSEAKAANKTAERLDLRHTQR